MASISGEQQANEIPQMNNRVQPFTRFDALKYLKESACGMLPSPRQFDRSDAYMELAQLQPEQTPEDEFFERLLGSTLPRIDVLRGIVALPPHQQLARTAAVDMRICQYMQLFYTMEMQRDSTKLYSHLKKGRVVARMVLQLGIDDEDGDASSQMLSLRQQHKFDRKYAYYLALKQAKYKKAGALAFGEWPSPLPLPDEIQSYYMIRGYYSALLQADPERVRMRISRATCMFEAYVMACDVNRTRYSHRCFVRWVRRYDWIPVH